MKKQITSSVLSTLLLGLSVPIEAQQPTKNPRIAFLAGTKPAAVAARVAAFQQGLREVGYVEGKNIVVEYPYAGERGSRA
jgi:putative tryptophan/tyrosine transport system substrate-binding protein